MKNLTQEELEQKELDAWFEKFFFEGRVVGARSLIVPIRLLENYGHDSYEELRKRIKEK